MKRWRLLTVVGVATFALVGGIAWAGVPGRGSAIQTVERSASKKIVIRSNTQSVGSGVLSTFSVLCHKGERATGGGYRLFPGFQVAETLPLMTAQGSIPIFSGHSEPQDGDTPDGWKVIGALNRDTTAHDVTVYVVCEA